MKKPAPLTAAEFFDRARKMARMHDRFSKARAAEDTRMSYSAIHDATIALRSPRRETLEALQKWSLAAISEFNCYISAIKTLGLVEPTPIEIEAAKTAAAVAKAKTNQ
jgi:hypothetical protein